MSLGFTTGSAPSSWHSQIGVSRPTGRWQVHSILLLRCGLIGVDSPLPEHNHNPAQRGYKLASVDENILICTIANPQGLFKEGIGPLMSPSHTQPPTRLQCLPTPSPALLLLRAGRRVRCARVLLQVRCGYCRGGTRGLVDH